MKATLLNMARTTEEKAAALEKLDQLSAALFNLKTKLGPKIDSLFSAKQKNSLIKLANQQGLSPSNREDLGHLTGLLKEKIHSLPEITITLAIEPTEEIIDLIYNWYVENCHQEAIWNILVDHNIIAGATFGYQGAYQDYSLKKQLSSKYQFHEPV